MDKKNRETMYDSVISKIENPYNDFEIKFNESGKLVICLIEYRILIRIKYVLNALLNVYSPYEIGLTIICGSSNYEYIYEIIKYWKNVNIINTKHENLNRGTYSALLKMPSFWEIFNNWSHVLIYQTDALIMRKIDDIYFDYDYIGAPWKKHDKKWTKYYGGNGGFSLRKVKTMIKHCECFRNIDHKDICQRNEDGYFCNINMKFPEDKNIHESFAVETIFSSNPIGCHQLYRYLDPSEFIIIIEYIKNKLYNRSYLREYMTNELLIAIPKQNN